MLNEELWIAEYSFAQKCFHHSLIKKSIEDNQDIIKRISLIEYVVDQINAVGNLSWIPFSIGTYEETQNDIDKMKQALDK